MPPPPRAGRPLLQRADLPDEFTPETVRRLDISTIRRLSTPGNGVLSPQDQQAFDAALRLVMQGTTDRLDESLRRARRGRPANYDPELRRSYLRTRARLDAQARRARDTFPQLTSDWEAPSTEEPASAAEPATTEPDDDVSLGSFESEIEQTSDTLEILERIATIEQQQLEHQRDRVLRDLRGVFFALLVSVAVIVAGLAPLVEATPDDRRLILLWTLVVCVVAGVGYAAVRAWQSSRRDPA